MSLHFLIDGYNVIKQDEFLKHACALKDARTSLIKIIQAKRLTGSKNNKVTIVFDGKLDLNSSLQHNKDPIKIIFSKDESADEIIKRVVSDSNNPKQIVVVTDDKAVMFFTRSLGAKVMPVRKFLGEQSKQLNLKQKKRKSGLLKIELTYQQQEAINQELRKLWE